MKHNFEGHEKLQAKLRSISKYGMDDADADAMANRLMRDICGIFFKNKNRWGGSGKPIILTFTYSSHVSKSIGATPDGRKLGGNVAHGVTPFSSSMTEGITAAINSCCKMPFDKFAGGASTMWDLDSSWVNEELVEALLSTFIQNGGQIFQGNTTDVSELIAAREHPEDYGHLIVRVGGYSARFVGLSSALQEDIITRIRHKS
jgi:formate C-acetyltransferase